MSVNPGGFAGPGFLGAAFLTPATILAVIFAFILGWRYLKYLERRDEWRTGGARGPAWAPPQPQVQATADVPPMAPASGGAFRDLRRAVTWCAVGVALILGAVILRGAPVLLLAGLIVLLVGVVKVLFWLLEPR